MIEKWKKLPLLLRRVIIGVFLAYVGTNIWHIAAYNEPLGVNFFEFIGLDGIFDMFGLDGGAKE